MAISDSVQTLLAAFSFGILLQAAGSVLIVNFEGHAISIFQDGRRLALVLFLFFGGMWALVDFLNLLIPITSPTACQVTLVFSTAFDQLARVGIEQFLLWSLRSDSKVTIAELIAQAILSLRFVTGGLLVGFTRPQFAPVCVARTSLLPISIIVLVLDLILFGVFLIRALSSGMIGELHGSSGVTAEVNKGLVWSILGLLLWTGTSVIMLLGIPSTLLILRTTLPAVGLLILIGIIVTFASVLLIPKGEPLLTPESISPFVAPLPLSRDRFQSNKNENGSPVAGLRYTKAGSLFVVNPSATPRDSPTITFQNTAIDNKSSSKPDFETSARGIDTRDIDKIPVPNENIRSFPALPTVPSQTKMSFFSRSKQAQQPSIRSLGISKPLMTAENSTASQSFARMQTIDLATAAANERERREGAKARTRLVANRPAPQPPLLLEDALRQSISVKRKDMPARYLRSMPTISSSGIFKSSVDVENGSSTSVSLSPAPEDEEVRRRSPRNRNNFDNTKLEKAYFQPSLQGKRTIGLPSNPKSQRFTVGKEQTVMFMNTIVYDDPGMVKTIINSAPKVYPSSEQDELSDQSPTKLYTTTLKSSGSIIHRPRPYRRNTEKDRAIFPSEPSPHHRRSKSGSSVTDRKSIVMSQPGNPTHLPPLPPPPPLPTSAATLTRLFPNDTRSMTFDEKIELLFPAPPGSLLPRSRRSSVPSLPRVPSVFISDTPAIQSPTEQRQLQSQRASKRTTIGSFGLQELQAPSDILAENSNSMKERQTYRFSANTYKDLTDQVGETWTTSVQLDNIDMERVVREGPNLAIPNFNTYNMATSASTETTSSQASSHAVATTYWPRYIYSGALSADTSKPKGMATSTFLRQEGSTQQASIPPGSPTRQSVYHGGGENLTVLSPEEPRSHDSITGSRLDANQSFSSQNAPILRGEYGWHRRIGDKLPTFSARDSNSRSRKVPPPTPLLLNTRTRNATVVVRAAEPSPIDSPEKAIKEIHAQLKRFEDPDLSSIGSILRNVPNSTATANGLEDQEADRFKLLENLEKEMGQQESQWQLMQNSLDRDSISVIMSPQHPDKGSSPVSLFSSSQTPPQILSRRARVRSGMTVRSKEQDSVSTTSTRSSDNSRASIWQQRLAEAQMEYIENAPTLLRNRNVNFFSLSKVQLSSPTPPDSLDSGTESDIEPEVESKPGTQQQSSDPRSVPRKLWQPVVSSPEVGTIWMWNPLCKVTTEEALSDPPTSNIRPSHRVTYTSLSISSSRLWSKPEWNSDVRSVVGLWGTEAARPKGIVARRATQRPQRKSKRVTFLPDILESPQPLPDKRNTLGIFQFPWGETSDSAIYQPALTYAPAGVSNFNGGFDTRSRALRPESEEYSSSFFDDYDEELDENEESDDDFDETTLWEIASLLKSKDVPSKNSLLPPPHAIIEDYDDDTDFESASDTENQSPVAQTTTIQLPIKPLEPSPHNHIYLWKVDYSSLTTSPGSLPIPNPEIWGSYIKAQSDTRRFRLQATKDLDKLASGEMWTPPKVSPCPKDIGISIWRATPVAHKISPAASSPKVSQHAIMWTPPPQIRAGPISGLFTINTAHSIQPLYRGADAPPIIVNYVRGPSHYGMASMSISSCRLWSPENTSQQVRDWLAKSTTSPATHSLWVPSVSVASVWTSGLFVQPGARSGVAINDSLPVVARVNRNLRSLQTPMDQPLTDELWKRPEIILAEHHWISESSIRPESPSTYSYTSSGSSSPASDSSSVISNSTKASSLWGLVRAAKIPAEWEAKSSKQTSIRSPHPGDSGMAVRQLSVGSLDPVRESGASVSRYIWQPEVATLEDAHVQRTHNKAEFQSPENPRYSSTTSSIRHNFKFPEDWDKALAEALVSREKERPVHFDKTASANWDEVSSLVVSRGRLCLHCAPELWGKSLGETLSGGISKPYDASIRHPVFFTEPLISTTNETHPAAFGYAIQIVSGTNVLWRRSPSNYMLAKLQLRSIRSNIPEATTLSAALHQGPPRKLRKSRSVDLPTLHSRSLWQLHEMTTKREHNWLSSTGRTSAGLWELRREKSCGEGHSLWVATKKSIPRPSRDIFGHMKGVTGKRRTPTHPAGVMQLDSSHLFRTPSDDGSDKHWLRSTSLASKNLGTWTASDSPTFPSVVADASTWVSTELGTCTPSLFSNPHREPRVRKKRVPISIKKIESSQMWRNSLNAPKSPQHWLIKGTCSKVEFRY